MIKIENLSFSFDNKEIFSDFSLTLEDRKITAITGKSGSGKSTLINLICGILKPDKGRIINESSTVSVVFQEDRLLPWYSVKENVSIVSDESTAEYWLGKVGLAESLNLKPSELSGGMKRRVALARALAYKSDTLILDEPFNGIDDETKTVLIRIIKEVSSERIILLVSHHQEEIRSLADYVYRIE